MKANSSKNIIQYSRPLIATMLVGSGLLQLAAPVLADGTAAGTSLSNTATASYEDPTNPSTSINATSNTVTVVVAEVAGITLTPSGIQNKTNPGGPIVVGNELYFVYTATNVGNTSTTFKIPTNPSLTGPGTLGVIEVSYDGGATWVTAPATTASVAPGGTVQVRVTVTANNTSTAPITVRLGNTPGDQTNPNQPYVASTANDDFYTAGGSPANGQREGSAIQSANIGAVIKNAALATVLATRTNVNDNSTPANVADDVITYGLSLKVENTDITNNGITPAPLTGKNITVGGASASHILVSNAIPAGTVLSGVPTAPSGWRVVYSVTPTATTADLASWTTTAPSNLADITRIGFINETTVPTVDIGSTVSGFTFRVVTSGKTGATYDVESIAQIFGQTSGGTAVVYDESGDKTPNNYDGTIDPSTITTPVVSSGIANSATDGVDTFNDNSGVGLGGEVSKFSFTYTAPTANSLLNGPLGTPEAVGATDSNDDFTNKSSKVDANVAPNGTIDPAAVGFNNTVKNTGTATVSVSLLPELPATAADLPVGSIVRIYTVDGRSASYERITGGFKFVTSVTPVGGPVINETTPITIDNLAPGATANYQVELDLPAGVALSTTSGKGFPVVINAFTGGTVTAPTTAEGNLITLATPTASNKTIDRIYTGFIKLAKESRILQGTGPAVAPGDGTFSDGNKKAAPGNIIEYRITYSNVSEKQIGSGNSILNASNLVITEDGTTAASKWGQDTDSNGAIDTSNIVGAALDSNPSTSTIQLYKGVSGLTLTGDQTGLTADADVTKYVNRVTTVVAPGVSRFFTFQRKVN